MWLLVIGMGSKKQEIIAYPKKKKKKKNPKWLIPIWFALLPK